MNWDQEVENLGPALFRYFCGSFPAQKADDLVQEVFVRLLRKYRGGDFDSSKGTIRMFAFGIAHYVRLETFQKRDTAESLSDDRSSAVSAYEFERRDDFLDLRRAITRLPEDQRKIILLLVTEDLSIEEISQILESPMGTVKSSIHRAKENLRGFLEDSTKGQSI